MNYDFYNPYRTNQNPNFTNPASASSPMNMHPNLNMSPSANPTMNANQSTNTKGLKDKVMSATELLMPSMRAITAMAYLMGMGYTYNQAKQTVESWNLGKMSSREPY